MSEHIAKTKNKLNVCTHMLRLTNERLEDAHYTPIWPQLEADRKVLERLIEDYKDQIDDI